MNHWCSFVRCCSCSQKTVVVFTVVESPSCVNCTPYLFCEVFRAAPKEFFRIAFELKKVSLFVGFFKVTIHTFRSRDLVQIRVGGGFCVPRQCWLLPAFPLRNPTALSCLKKHWWNLFPDCCFCIAGCSVRSVSKNYLS